jgi:hypothetical protein
MLKTLKTPAKEMETFIRGNKTEKYTLDGESSIYSNRSTGFMKDKICGS